MALIHDACSRERTVPFDWNGHECLAFCGNVALEMLHRDPIVHVRGRYDSEESAKRFGLANGWRSVGDLAATIFPEIHVSQARSGDWALVENDDGTESLGVVAGANIVSRTKEGLGLVALTKARRAFRVS